MVDTRPAVFLFIGEEKHLKDEAVDALKVSILDKSSADMDYSVFYGSDTTSREIIECARTPPFLSPKRLIVVKDFEKLPQEDRERLLDYADRPSESACMVLDMRDDSVVRDLPRASGHVVTRKFDPPDASHAASWIRKAAGLRGKKIDDGAAETLVELKGTGLSVLNEEVDKLAAYAGDREMVTLDDVEATVGRSFTGSAFDIIWAMGSRDAARAVRLVRDLALSGKKPQEIIGIISWHLNRLARARIMKDAGKTDYAIIAGLKISRRYAQDFLRQLDSLDLDGIGSRMETLLEADLNLKSSRFDQALVFETAIVRLCLG